MRYYVATSTASPLPSRCRSATYRHGRYAVNIRFLFRGIRWPSWIRYRKCMHQSKVLVLNASRKKVIHADQWCGIASLAVAVFIYPVESVCHIHTEHSGSRNLAIRGIIYKQRELGTPFTTSDRSIRKHVSIFHPAPNVQSISSFFKKAKVHSADLEIWGSECERWPYYLTKCLLRSYPMIVREGEIQGDSLIPEYFCVRQVPNSFGWRLTCIPPLRCESPLLDSARMYVKNRVKMELYRSYIGPILYNKRVTRQINTIPRGFSGFFGGFYGASCDPLAWISQTREVHRG
jgi:hypothetical protein